MVGAGSAAEPSSVVYLTGIFHLGADLYSLPFLFEKGTVHTHFCQTYTHSYGLCVFVHAVPRRSSPSIWPIKTLASCNAHLLLDILKIYLYSFKLKQKVAIVTHSQCLILPLPICVPVGRLLTLLKTEFPHLKMGLLTTT